MSRSAVPAVTELLFTHVMALYSAVTAGPNREPFWMISMRFSLAVTQPVVLTVLKEIHYCSVSSYKPRNVCHVPRCAIMKLVSRSPKPWSTYAERYRHKRCGELSCC